jgi:hypothetical protein
MHMTYKEFFLFVFSGTIVNNELLKLNNLTIFITCFKALLKITALVFFVKILSIYFFGSSSIIDSTVAKTDFLKLIFIILLGPLLEELAFRLPLSLIKNEILISLPFICFMIFVFLKKNTSLSKSIIFLGLLVLFCILFYLVKKIDFKNVYFVFFLNLSVFLFAFSHWNNSKFISNIGFFDRTIIYILPMLIMGYFLSYIRLKYGFYWSLILHITHNLIFTLPIIIKWFLK